jgi:hypothetical protein
VCCQRRERGKRQVRSGTTGSERAANRKQSASSRRRADPGAAEAIVGLRYCHLRTKTGAERLKEVACSSQGEWCRFGDPKWRAVYFAFLTGVYSALGTICNPPQETLVTPVEAAAGCYVGSWLSTFSLYVARHGRIHHAPPSSRTPSLLNVRAGNCRGLTHSLGAMTHADGSAACLA